MAEDAYTAFGTKITPQSEPIPGKNQVKNNAGGYTYQVDAWGQLARFLILGSEGGTYYAREPEHTKQNAHNLIACIAEDGVRVVNTIVEISDSGRAPKNKPAIFALAACFGATRPDGTPDLATRHAAELALPKVCRIGTHLFQFMNYVQNFRGNGAVLQRALQNWYLNQEPRNLAYQVSKYQSREGWTQRDVLRTAKPRSSDAADPVAMGQVFDWVTGRENTSYGEYLDAVNAAKTATPEEMASLIERHNLPWEVWPTEMLNNPLVWEAALDRMGLTAMLRNLNRFSAIGMTGLGHGATVNEIISRLTNGEALTKARVHPISVLIAQKTYGLGHGIKGSMTWKPNGKIVDALNDAFYASFGAIEPADKRTFLGIDVSGSMGSNWGGLVAGVLTAAEAAAAMAMVAYRTEPDAEAFGFAKEFVDLRLTPKMTLNQVLSNTSKMNFGTTDCALPMLHALKNNLEVDTFIVYTDNETWAGNIHPSQALQQYRDKTGIPAKLIVVGMTATNFSIADPSDGGMMDVVGFDTAAPVVMNDFSAGR
ncbi:MAG: TROVE domain-containing protein [bacterium]